MVDIEQPWIFFAQVGGGVFDSLAGSWVLNSLFLFPFWSSWAFGFPAQVPSFQSYLT